ncbi:MAG: glycosyl transferase family 1 [Deltaproteobacteria bacterium HGW-Deltaproteobacteria-21]|nr:MAG: glycosyl transferase family 1 [Deltaproteobacteria bacterium HGW-Deltaproteobacteria-21]
MNGANLFDYREVVGPDVIEELTILASHVGGRTIKMVNSTAVGGGVAEMLHRVVPLLNELGIKVSWEVIKGDEPFYEITKSFHNGLQGKAQIFSEDEFEKYLSVNRMNAKEFIFEEDLIVIHDPQPAAMILHKSNLKNRWVWRCHIDLSRPNTQLWQFLRPTIEKYDAAIFTSPLFSPELAIPQYQFFPAIDPLDDKNRDLEESYIDGVFEKYGIPRDKPVVTQISRYDPWKDPVGVVQAFKLARKYVDCRLLLVGDKADDDPESDKILELVRNEAGNDPDIHILLFSPSIPLEINAFQRGSQVILQKSLKEGFALTVAEALWKGRPVIGGAVGGIPAQIIDGHTGLLVHTVEGASLAIRSLLNQPELAMRLGENGKRRVRNEFLITKKLKRYLLLLLALDKPHGTIFLD